MRSSWRSRTLSELRGDVLDVGAGDGAALPYLRGNTRVTCLEPHPGSARWLRSLETGAEVLEARAEDIPLDDATMDFAVCSAVLCSVSDQTSALREIHRVLRPGGQVLLLEHVAAPRGWLLRGQRFVAPVSRLLDRGCDPARETELAIRCSGFSIVDLCRLVALGPWGIPIPHLSGVLSRPASGRPDFSVEEDHRKELPHE
ncbi:class I SAM-dependent methyltransferase [Kribbella sp. NPDC051586]|uniref:class I SAM-dependent methyltransferase n=1 Tax=Kribbella sp. NPDC051586 TaxID=3364118 RepID=UPI0037916B88